MGGAAFFGIAIISGSRLVGILAIISVLSHFWFLSCVEKYAIPSFRRIVADCGPDFCSPHMKRLYGNALRKETGVSKTLRNAAKSNSHRAPPQVKRAVQELQGTIGRVVDDTQMAVEAFLKRCELCTEDHLIAD
jgi:phosphatidylethanolamine N-methyltransferase